MSLLCDTITRAVHQHNLEPLIHRYFPHNLQIGSDSTSQTSSHVHASMSSYTAPFRCYRVGTTLWVNLGRRLDPTWTDHWMFATNEAFGNQYLVNNTLYTTPLESTSNQEDSTEEILISQRYLPHLRSYQHKYPQVYLSFLTFQSPFAPTDHVHRQPTRDHIYKRYVGSKLLYL